MTSYQIASIEAVVRLDDAPHTVGTAGYSGKRRTVRATTARFNVGPAPSSTVTLMGPSINAKGEESASYFEVKVTLDPDARDYAQAPEWLAAIVAEVRS